MLKTTSVMMRLIAIGFALLSTVAPLVAQAPGRFPPDSLLNTQVIPRSTPVMEVVGMMRNFALDLGVRCQFCHVGEEGLPLEQFDFAKDQKRNKLVARQMLRMMNDINRRLDTLPGLSGAAVPVTCRTCHRGISRPMPLFAVMIEAATAAGADSALRAYRTLRERYYGHDAYDFGESSLNTAAFRLARAGRFDDGTAILNFNESLFPTSSALSVFRGNIQLMRGDTSSAATAFLQALARDTSNAEARGRLRSIGRK
ncbi:MAG: c-type cytochrome [Gemmatimonadetes bacterium]|nr:c-type cytochrome [Gemmatimonadota bacterium]